MQPASQKSKSYGALVIIGAIIALAYWHPGLSGLAKPSNVTLMENTTIMLRLDQSISSKTSSSGQHFGGKLAQPVLVDGRVVLPVGTEFSGSVAQATSAGRLAGGATLRIVLNSFSFQGKEYKVKVPPLVGATHGQGKRTAKMAGGGAAIGVLVGAVARGGKGALIGAAAGAGAGAVAAAATNKAQDIVLPAESLIAFHLGEGVTVAISPTSPARQSGSFLQN
jgi:hypothetical protein